jgi:hypothetical protein
LFQGILSQTPFKYNPNCLEEEFQSIVKDNWCNFSPDIDSSACEQFSSSLKLVKEKVAAWTRERFRNIDANISEVEKYLEDLVQENDQGIYNEEGLKNLKHMESL